ncbi:MAG: type II secretion system protein [Opitutaceae bacterium]
MNLSHKTGFTLVEIMIVIVIIGLLVVMGIPAYQKIRTSSQERAIINNLRQLASGADQYFLETGLVSVFTEELVGTGPSKYVKKCNAVAGELYPASIHASLTSITASSPSATISILF